jgi:hypothetical protein
MPYVISDSRKGCLTANQDAGCQENRVSGNNRRWKRDEGGEKTECRIKKVKRQK